MQIFFSLACPFRAGQSERQSGLICTPQQRVLPTIRNSSLQIISCEWCMHGLSSLIGGPQLEGHCRIMNHQLTYNAKKKSVAYESTCFAVPEGEHSRTNVFRK